MQSATIIIYKYLLDTVADAAVSFLYYILLNNRANFMQYMYDP